MSLTARIIQADLLRYLIMVSSPISVTVSDAFHPSGVVHHSAVSNLYRTFADDLLRIVR